MKVASIEAVVRALNNERVPFIVVGGLAVNAHGYGRYTGDIDLVVKLNREAIHGAFRALSSLGYSPRVPITADGFADRAQRERWVAEKGMRVLNFHSDRHRETPIDVFVAEPFDFDAEVQRCLVQEVAPGLSITIVSLPTLVRLKRDAARPQDLADLDELRLLHGDAIDG